MRVRIYSRFPLHVLSTASPWGVYHPIDNLFEYINIFPIQYLHDGNIYIKDTTTLFPERKCLKLELKRAGLVQWEQQTE